MSQIEDTKAQLDQAGIAYEADASLKDLKALLPKEDKKVVEDISTENIVVNDPQVLRPKELPLVILPPEGQDWKNPEQAEYARYLNGYAYRNEAKWAAKKATLLARLVEIGNNPARLAFYRGSGDGDGKISYKNKLIEQ